MITIRPTKTIDFLRIMEECVQSNKIVLGLGTSDECLVFDTGKNDMDVEEYQKLNAIVIPFVSNGGSSIIQPGDLSIYFTAPGYHQGWSRCMYKHLIRWFEAQGLPVKEENNDLTIYGKKFAGYGESVTAARTNSGFYVAMNNSQELVKKVCLKPKTRITAGLHDYGFTNNEVFAVIEEATKMYLDATGGDPC